MKEMNAENFMELLGSLPVQGSELHPADVSRIREVRCLSEYCVTIKKREQ